MSIYNEALAEKIREGAPLASYSIDRRALTQFSEALQDRSVSAPMCFLCGCIYMHRERPEWDRRPGQAESENYIQWKSAFDESKRKFLGMSKQQTEAYYGLETYLKKFNTDAGNFLDLRREGVNEFNDWTCEVPFENGNVKIVCCPEDRECTSECLSQTCLCDKCRIPLCRTCKASILRKCPTQSPVALANDMLAFYAPKSLCDGTTSRLWRSYAQVLASHR